MPFFDSLVEQVTTQSQRGILSVKSVSPRNGEYGPFLVVEGVLHGTDEHVTVCINEKYFAAAEPHLQPFIETKQAQLPVFKGHKGKWLFSHSYSASAVKPPTATPVVKEPTQPRVTLRKDIADRIYREAKVRNISASDVVDIYLREVL